MNDVRVVAHNPTGTPAYSVPNDNDDDPWTVADALAEMMNGAYPAGTRVDIYGYRLFLSGDGTANVWTVHPPDGGRALDALALDAFRSAAAVESYILDIAERADRRGR